MEEKLDKLNKKMNILFKKISRIEDKLNDIGLNEILIEFSNFYFEKRLKNKNYYKSLEKHLSKYYSNDDKSEDSDIFSINSNKKKKNIKTKKNKKKDSEDSDKSSHKSVDSEEEEDEESDKKGKKISKKKGKKEEKESSSDEEEKKKPKKKPKKETKRKFSSSSDEEDEDKKKKIKQSPLISNLDSLIIGKNEEYNKTLKNWINSNKNINSKLLYRMSKDGSNFNNFHSLCDNQGPTISLFKLTNQDIIGIYTPLSWDKNSNRKTDSQIFIFSLTKNYKIQSEIYCSDIQGPSSEYIKFEKGMQYISFYGNPDIIKRFNLKGTYTNSEVEVFKIIIE